MIECRVEKLLRLSRNKYGMQSPPTVGRLGLILSGLLRES